MLLHHCYNLVTTIQALVFLLNFFQTFTSYQTALLLRGILSIITGIIISLYASWALSLVMIVAYFLTISNIVIICFTKKYGVKAKVLLEQAGKIASEAIENIHTIASLGLENRMESIYTAQLNRIMR